MVVLESLADKLSPVLLAPGSHFSVYSLAAEFLIGFGFLACRRWRRRGRIGLPALARAYFSRGILLHRSTRADYLYFFVNVFVTGIFIGWFCFESSRIIDVVQLWLTDGFGPRSALSAPDYALRGATTVVAFLAYEFGYWFDHYLKHRIPFLWETHKTHHTAERLTPWTVWRVHPLDSLVFTNVVALCVGLSVGAVSYMFGARHLSYAIDCTNVFLVLFFLTLVHLQHSEVWIPFTGALGKIFMSPAHHQIHHSIDPAHYNSNMGNALAIWDWLFGTLVLPQEKSPRLAFGVAEEGVDPHSATQLLIAPIFNVAKALAPKSEPPPNPAVESGFEVSR